MAKKSKKPGRFTKAKIAAFIGIGLILFLGGNLVYAYKNDGSLKIPLGNDRAFGVWWDPHGEPRVETGRFGCCSPYCEDMFEIECSREYGYDGTFTTGRCDYDVLECREGCCLPECKEYPKIQCEGDHGISGDWYSSQCRDLSECEIGCCVLEGQKTQEKKAPCESTGGSWTLGECKIGYYVDMESTSTTTKSGITVSQHIDYHLYTCSESVYGLWRGKTTVDTEAYGHGVTAGDTDEDMNFPLNFDADNGVINVSQNIGSFSVYMNGSVNESQMTVNFGAPGIVDHHAQGAVQQGAPECQPD